MSESRKARERIFTQKELVTLNKDNGSSETFEKIAEHLYKRQYQTAKGEWRTKFFILFTDWKASGENSRSAILSTMRAMN